MKLQGSEIIDIFQCRGPTRLIPLESKLNRPEVQTIFSRRLPRVVLLLGWVSFFTDISSEMLYPLLPLFLVDQLGASALSLGVMEGIALGSVSIINAWSGFASDRSRQRMPYVRWGYGIPVLGKALIAIAFAWPMVFAGRVLDRVGKGLRTSPRDAMIADLVSSEDRGRAIGFHRAMDTAGAVIGVLIAAAFLWFSRDEHAQLNYRALFILATFFAGCSFLIILRAPTGTTPKGLPKLSAGRGASLKVRELSPQFWRVLLVLSLFAIANSSDTFLLLRAANFGFSPLEVVLAYALYNFSYAALAHPAGILSDRVGRWPLILTSWVIYGVVYGSFAFSLTHGWTVWILFLLYGVYMALSEGTAKALVLDVTGESSRASALGILNLVLGLSALTTNLIAGYLWSAWGPQYPFLLGASFALAAAAYGALLYRHR